MGSLKSYLKNHFHFIILFVAIISCALFTAFFNLSSIPPGVSEVEKTFIHSSSNINLISTNPINAPIKLLFLALNQLGLDSIVTYRAISAILGLIFVLCFYLYIKEYQTRRVAILATILLFTSSWYLHNARLSLAYIALPLSVIIILLGSRKLSKANNTALFSIILGIILGCTLYTPMIPFILILILIFGIGLKSEKVKFRHLALVIIAMLITAIPLIYATVQNPDLLYSIFGIPKILLPIEWIKRILAIPIFLFAKGPFNPVTNLGRLPILDIFSSVLLVFGVYAIYFKLKERHFRQIILVLIGSFVLIALNGENALPLILPIVYIILSYGVALILQQWFTVFPKNPLVKNVGIFIVVVSLSFVSFYHLKRYFIAWPNSPTTKVVFKSQLD